MLAAAGNRMADCTFDDNVAAGVGGSVFVFFTASLDAERVTIRTSQPDGLFALLADYVSLADSVIIADYDGGYAVDVTGVFDLTINGSVVTAGLDSHCLRASGTAAVLVIDSLLSKETGLSVAHAVACTDSHIVVQDSVVCASYSYLPTSIFE